MFFTQFESSVCPDFGVRILGKNTDNGQVYFSSSVIFVFYSSFSKMKFFMTRVSNLVSVVTGCTRGIGQVYVDELAQRKMDIVLIGRSLPALKEMAAKVGELFSLLPMCD